MPASPALQQWSKAALQAQPGSKPSVGAMGTPGLSISRAGQVSLSCPHSTSLAAGKGQTGRAVNASIPCPWGDLGDLCPHPPASSFPSSPSTVPGPLLIPNR